MTKIKCIRKPYVRITLKVTRETAREEKESTRNEIAVRLIIARALSGS